MSPVIKRRLVLTVGVLITVPALFWGSAEFTSRPGFCNSCHYMEPFYDSWAVSSHADVTCTMCHFEPGLTGKVKGKMNGLYQLTKYVSLAYKRSKPWAEISDESCMRSSCHTEQTLLGPITFKNVRFDHSHHLGDLRRGKELRCTSCHSQMVQGEHILVTEETCFLCHMKDRNLTQTRDGCTTCHTADIFIEKGSQLRYNHTAVAESEKPCELCHVNTVEGNASVAIQQCINCHWQTDFLERYNDPEFLHLNHVANNKVECIACHAPIQHRIRRTHELTGEDCASCHQDMHKSQVQLFTGRAGQTITPKPNPMFEAGLACMSCHIFHKENLEHDGETMVSRGEACDICHGRGYGELLSNWESFLADRQKNVGDYWNEARGLIDQGMASANQVLELAHENIQLVERAQGIHNIDLSDKLLKEASDYISEALKVAGKGSKVKDFASSAALVPPSCINCHIGVESREEAIYDLTFSHDRHLIGGVACQKCHSNLRQHGELLHTRADCLNCHHTETGKACETCHEQQQALLSGETPFFSAEADLMWQAEFTCADCHTADDHIEKRGPGLCADCHDEDYPEMVDQWREEIQDLIQSLPPSQGALRAWLEEEGSIGGHNAIGLIEALQTKLEAIP